jgi:hypothetical protein
MKKILKDLQENIELYFISGFVIVFFVCLAYIGYVDLMDIKNEKVNQNIEITEVTQVIKTIEEMAEPIRPFYVEDYATEEEIEMIAKVLYREARGVKDKDQIAAVAWCILNRVDHPNHPNTIKEVIIQPEQFAWVEDTPVEDWLLELANDVVYRWCLEKEGQENVGRTLPKGYCFFIGDGTYNHFRQNFNSKQTWNWSYPQQY